MKNIIDILIKSLGILFVIISFYIYVEPRVIMASENTVTQNVISEIAFATSGSNITLSPAIDVSLGGQANGQTQVVVKTNDYSGYSMTITASSSLGMIGVASTTNYIPVYVPALPGIPDYDFTVPANTAYFGYTVEASTTSDLAQSFKDDAGVCNSIIGSDTVDKCWLSASSTAYTVINRTSATALSGATTTIKFKVMMTANPIPGLPDDTYVATTTLTATTN